MPWDNENVTVRPDICISLKSTVFTRVKYFDGQPSKPSNYSTVIRGLEKIRRLKIRRLNSAPKARRKNSKVTFRAEGATKKFDGYFTRRRRGEKIRRLFYAPKARRKKSKVILRAEGAAKNFEGDIYAQRAWRKQSKRAVWAPCPTKSEVIMSSKVCRFYTIIIIISPLKFKYPWKFSKTFEVFSKPSKSFLRSFQDPRSIF